MDSLLDFVTGTLGGKIDPELLTQLRGAIDPLSPDLLDENFANGVKSIAQGLAEGTASSIRSSLADQKTGLQLTILLKAQCSPCMESS